MLSLRHLQHDELYEEALDYGLQNSIEKNLVFFNFYEITPADWVDWMEGGDCYGACAEAISNKIGKAFYDHLDTGAADYALVDMALAVGYKDTSYFDGYTEISKKELLGIYNAIQI